MKSEVMVSDRKWELGIYTFRVLYFSNEGRIHIAQGQPHCATHTMVVMSRKNSHFVSSVLTLSIAHAVKPL
jgi:hypothetical protein